MMRFYQAQLGEAGYGEVGTLIDTATLLMAFATLSIGESIIRFGLDKNYNKSQVFSIGLRITFIGLLGCLLLLPLLSWLTGLFPDNDVLVLMNRYSWLLLIYVFTGSVKSTVGLFVRSAGYVRLYAIDGIFTTIMNILFNLLLLWAFNLGVIGYLLSVILADVCSVIFLSFMANLRRYFLLCQGFSHRRGICRQSPKATLEQLPISTPTCSAFSSRLFMLWRRECCSLSVLC